MDKKKNNLNEIIAKIGWAIMIDKELVERGNGNASLSESLEILKRFANYIGADFENGECRVVVLNGVNAYLVLDARTDNRDSFLLVNSNSDFGGCLLKAFNGDKRLNN